MENKKLFYLFIGTATAITLYLTYLVFKPFLSPIVLGIIFSIVFHPTYLKLLDFTKGRRTIASLITCLLITMIIIVPLTYVTTVFVGEITSAYNRLDEVMQSGTYRDLFPFLDNPTVQSLYKKISRHIEVLQIDIRTVFLNTFREIGSYSVGIMTGAAMNVVIFILNIILMLFTIYYLLRDSDTIAIEIKRMIPLTERQNDRIFKRLKEIISATLYGTITSAAAQGFLGWLAFWALGIGSPVIWGVVMGLLAVLPVLGAFFIWLPASLFLLIQGSYVKAIILFLWGSLVISLIDNLIWPILVSGKAMLHPLATFFGILGGIIVFGPIGLFAGPFVIALFLILVEIVREVSEPEKEGSVTSPPLTGRD